MNQVEGDEDCKEAMGRLSGAQESPALYPLQNILQDTIKSSSRSDTDVLGKFIRSLRTATETYIGSTVDLAVATHPSLPLLELHMLDKAFNSAGMSHLRSYKAWNLDSVHQVVASLA